MPDSVNADGADTCKGGLAPPSSIPSSSDGNDPQDTNLRAVIKAWPELPVALKKAVLALIQETGFGDRGYAADEQHL